MRLFSKDIMYDIGVVGMGVVFLGGLYILALLNPPRQYYIKLSDGTEFSCNTLERVSCGYDLFDCSDHQDHYCMTNLVLKDRK